MNNFYELSCRYDARKSFYGKAMIKIVEDDKYYKEELYSYNTLVAYYVLDKTDDVFNKEYRYLGCFSQTTSRHQKEFFKQLGLDDAEIKELIKYGVYKI